MGLVSSYAICTNKPEVRSVKTNKQSIQMKGRKEKKGREGRREVIE